MRTRQKETFGPINNRGEQGFGKKYARSHRYGIAGLKLLPNLSCGAHLLRNPSAGNPPDSEPKFRARLMDMA